MKRHFVWLALTGMLAGCDSPTEPAQLGSTLDPDGALIPHDAPAVVGSADGSTIRYAGSIEVHTNFSVKKFGDGSAKGFFHYEAGSTEIKSEVTCMTLVDGDKAWIAGIITESSNPSFLGAITYFYTFDNGEGANAPAPDLISRLRLEFNEGEDLRFCEELPQILTAFDVVHGNVNVRS